MISRFHATERINNKVKDIISTSDELKSNWADVGKDLLAGISVKSIKDLGYLSYRDIDIARKNKTPFYCYRPSVSRAINGGFPTKFKKNVIGAIPDAIRETIINKKLLEPVLGKEEDIPVLEYILPEFGPIGWAAYTLDIISIFLLQHFNIYITCYFDYLI